MSDTCWEIRTTMLNIKHVVPVSDTAEHNPDCWQEGGIIKYACKCLPYEDQGVVVHHAFDGRPERALS